MKKTIIIATSEKRAIYANLWILQHAMPKRIIVDK